MCCSVLQCVAVPSACKHSVGTYVHMHTERKRDKEKDRERDSVWERKTKTERETVWERERERETERERRVHTHRNEREILGKRERGREREKKNDRFKIKTNRPYTRALSKLSCRQQKTTLWQNIVSFIGLFCKKDLSFWGTYRSSFLQTVV